MSGVARSEATLRVRLPRVHMAGSDAHYDAHIDVGSHGLALFLSSDAEYPVLDIDGTAAQLDELVSALKAAVDASHGARRSTVSC